MPLLKRPLPFDDPDWLYELKYDGFRALAVIEHGRTRLISRNGHPFASFSALAESISDSLPNVRAVIDGEICSLDRRGRPQFKNLLFRRGNPPCFFAFDLLTYGKDLRTERLLDRKQELRRLLAKVSSPFPLRYAEHVEGSGTALFQRICELDSFHSSQCRSNWGKGRTGILSPVRVVCLGVIGCEATRLSRKPEHCTSSKRFLSVRAASANTRGCTSIKGHGFVCLV